MTVADLIALLQDMPQHYIVVSEVGEEVENLDHQDICVRNMSCELLITPAGFNDAYPKLVDERNVAQGDLEELKAEMDELKANLAKARTLFLALESTIAKAKESTGAEFTASLNLLQSNQPAQA